MASMLQTMEGRIAEIDDTVERILSTAEKFQRSMSDNENDQVEKYMVERKQIADRVTTLKEAELIREARGKIVADLGLIPGTSGAFTHSRGGVYNRDSHNSYFVDVARAATGNPESRERLDIHAREYNDEIAKKNAPELRAINTTAGSGGEFAPPLWAIDNWIAALRAGRATANALNHQELPTGTSVIDFPIVSTGTTVALQSPQNTAISQTDITTSSKSAPVFTIAGGQTVSMQLYEQSPLSGTFDQLILADLLADYSRAMGNLVLNGTGTAPQPYGLLNVPGTQSVTYTDATPTFMGTGKLYAKIGQAISGFATTRFAPPTHIIMHPRRWAWLSVQVDTAGRAVVLPTDSGLVNASGIDTNNEVQGIVGKMQGLPVIADPNVPINLGAGTNQDPIIVAKLDDTWLYEQQPRLESFNQTYANTLSLFVRLYNYGAMVTRYGNSISIISGTGLITPTF